MVTKTNPSMYARLRLFQEHAKEGRAFYLQERAKQNYPRYSEDPILYKRLLNQARSRAYLRLIELYRSEYLTYLKEAPHGS